MKMKLSNCKNIDGKQYTMLMVDREEAAALIVSLAKQLEAHNANTGRLESYIECEDYIGRFSIAVQPPLNCIQCHKDIKPYSGKLEKEGHICKDHLTHQELGRKIKNEKGSV
jgi:hypothetical protein